MMSAIEHEIVAKFRLLDKNAQQRVLKEIEQAAIFPQTAASLGESMSIDTWVAWAKEFGSHIHEKYSDFHPNSVDLLNESREERLDDLMGGS